MGYNEYGFFAIKFITRGMCFFFTQSSKSHPDNRLCMKTGLQVLHRPFC